jgi:hypothetical protein
VIKLVEVSEIRLRFSRDVGRVDIISTAPQSDGCVWWIQVSTSWADHAAEAARQVMWRQGGLRAPLKLELGGEAAGSSYRRAQLVRARHAQLTTPN